MPRRCGSATACICRHRRTCSGDCSSSAWLIADVQLDLIFETQATQMWETAIRRLGAEPSMLQMGHGVH